MSIAILPMSAEYNWNPATVGLIQSSFFWGYLLTQVCCHIVMNLVLHWHLEILFLQFCSTFSLLLRLLGEKKRRLHHSLTAKTFVDWWNMGNCLMYSTKSSTILCLWKCCVKQICGKLQILPHPLALDSITKSVTILCFLPWLWSDLSLYQTE